VEILPREIKKNTEEIFKVRIPIIKIKLLTMLLKKKKYWYSKSIKISIKLKFLKIP
jgi:hypothetical protein